MKRFKKILVGVDLSWGDSFVADELSTPNAEAVRQASWLARLNSATIDFLFSLDVSAKTEQLLAETSTYERTVLDDARSRLDDLVAEARKQGIEAVGHVAVGKSWLELVRRVIGSDHDLVIVGTRHMGAVQGFLVGSTGLKLLRKCPCAVWVTQPLVDNKFDSILVAHDLRQVGDVAMELGCSMAELQDAQLHVVHAAEYPEFDYVFPAKVSAERKQAYRSEAETHINNQLANVSLPLPAKVHFATEAPDIAILNCAEKYRSDLVIMGTVGRTGIPGFITGNTAEKLLPRISCSLLAVKPPRFKSPVELSESH